jgi:putative intracellular protease/amidase
MRIFKAVLICLFFTILTASMTKAENIKVLLIISNNYGANYYLKYDDFEQFGWEVTTAGVTRTVNPCPLYAGPLGCPIITVDTLISEITDISQFDVLALAPASWRAGNPHGDLLASQEALDLIVAAVDSGLVIYAHCAGPRVLAAADVLQGVNITGRPEYQSEYTAAGAIYLGNSIPPVIDGNIVTSTRGLYFHEQNCEAVATALENIRGTDFRDCNSDNPENKEEVK